TRSYGDWSSDVCSSDLRGLQHLARRGAHELIVFGFHQPACPCVFAPTPKVLVKRDPTGLDGSSQAGGLRDALDFPVEPIADIARSEERRVGKECRSRLW